MTGKSILKDKKYSLSGNRESTGIFKDEKILLLQPAARNLTTSGGLIINNFAKQLF